MLILIWEGNRFLILFSYRQFTAPFKALKRLLFLVPANIFYTAVILVLAKCGGYYIDHHEWKLITDSDSFLYINDTRITMGRFGSTLIKSVLISIFFFGFYGVFHYIMRLRTVEKEKKRCNNKKTKRNCIASNNISIRG
ncbi:MAG: hypothetical protein WKF97_26615 [Chitinophagaceae bacterium]